MYGSPKLPSPTRLELIGLAQSQKHVHRLMPLLAIPRPSKSVGSIYSAMVAVVGIALFVTVSGPAGAPVQDVPAPEVLEALADKDDLKRLDALDKLILWGPKAEVALNKTMECLDSPNERIREKAVRLVVEIGAPSIPHLLRAVQAGKDLSCLSAGDALEELGPIAREASTSLNRLLNDPRPRVRISAIRAYTSIHGSGSLLTLCRLLETDSDQDVHDQILRSIITHRLRSHYASRTVARFLTNAVIGGKEELAGQAARVLESMEKEGIAGLNELLIDAKSPTKTLRYSLAAIEGLAKRRVKEVQVLVPCLTKLAINEDRLVRMAALSALGAIGPDAKQVVPTLVRLSMSAVGEEKIKLAVAIVLIQPDEVVGTTILVNGLKDTDVGVRCLCAQLIDKLQVKHNGLVVALTHALRDSEENVRMSAANRLCDLGAAGAPALAELRRLLSDDSVTIRAVVRRAIKNIEWDLSRLEAETSD